MLRRSTSSSSRLGIPADLALPESTLQVSNCLDLSTRQTLLHMAFRKAATMARLPTHTRATTDSLQHRTEPLNHRTPAMLQVRQARNRAVRRSTSSTLRRCRRQVALPRQCALPSRRKIRASGTSLQTAAMHPLPVTRPPQPARPHPPLPLLPRTTASHPLRSRTTTHNMHTTTATSSRPPHLPLPLDSPCTLALLQASSTRLLLPRSTPARAGSASSLASPARPVRPSSRLPGRARRS